MARESHTTEVVSTSSTASGNREQNIQNAMRTCFNAAGEFTAFSWMKIKQLFVILWTFVHRQVFLPTMIFCLGIYAVVEKFVTTHKHRVMCTCHEMAAAMARVKASRLTSILTMISLVFILFSTSFYSLGLEVIIDGKSVGYVMNKADFNESVAHVQQRVSEIIERPYAITPNVSYSFGVIKRDKILKSTNLEQILFSQADDISNMYVLTVDDQIVGASKNKETLQTMLDGLLGNKQSRSMGEKREFTRDVKIAHKMVDSKYLRSHDEMRKILTSNKQEQVTHTIIAGETFGEIAQKYGMKKSQLMALNPGIDPNWVIAGKKLVVSKEVPFLSVKATRSIREIKTIPYNIKEVADPNLYKGKKFIKVAGVQGQKAVVSNVTYVDEQEASRTTVSSEVMRQPIDAVVVVGAKPLPSKASSGSFRKPTGFAYVSSNYGYRGREFHTGVDFALAYGSPVVAADGGTVAYAGWKGDYGKLVIINHDNGMQTYYGHNSSLLVQPGQRVGKGEQIARIGSTGRSTGPHCHFEIRVNGRHVNPWRFLS